MSVGARKRGAVHPGRPGTRCLLHFTASNRTLRVPVNVAFFQIFSQGESALLTVKVAGRGLRHWLGA